MPIPLPKWLDNEADRERETKRFLLRIAADFACKNGTIRKLSLLVGYTNQDSLHHIFHEKGKITPEVAIAIERIVGRGVMTRAMLRPDLFGNKD